MKIKTQTRICIGGSANIASQMISTPKKIASILFLFDANIRFNYVVQ